MSVEEVKRAQTSLTCPVCYQLYKNPKYLPCYHSYCERCLEKMQIRSKVICPDCKKEARVPAGGVKKFATNFFINRLVDDLILKKKVPGKEKVKCDNCGDDHSVVSFCPDCNMFLCQACSDQHQHNEKCQDHNLVPLTELKPNKNVPAVQAKVEIPLCKEHDYELKHYCETCDVLVCMYCTMKEHSGHNHDSTKAVAGKLKKVTAPIEEMVQDLSIAHNKIDKMRNKIRTQGEEVNKIIDQHYGQLIDDLLQQKDQLKQQVYDIVSHKEVALKSQLDEVDSTHAELLNIKEVSAALASNSDHEVLSAKKQVIDGMQQLTEKFQKLSKNPVQSATMEFVPTDEDFPQFGKLCSTAPPDPHTTMVCDLPQSIIVGEEVEATVITNDSNGDQCSKGDNRVLVELQSSSGTVAVAVVRDYKDGSYVASFIPEQVGQANLSVSLNGQHIKGSPYSIIVCKNYQLLHLANKTVHNIHSMGQPWGIAFGRNGIWAVADFTKHCVHIFDDQDQLIKTFGTCSGSGPLNSPRGVAFDDDNHLYVADTANHRVQKFDVNGYYLLQFGGYGSGNGQLNHPFGVVAHNGRVYVADKDNHRISVYQDDGQFCFSFGSNHLGDPWDVAINADNRLLVADGSHHCIVTHTLDGSYVGKFGAQGSKKGQLNKPYSLCSDVNGFILVTDGNHRVNVFDHAGKFIYCFGSCGASKSQFDHPYGISLSSNNNIYICDSWNNRVQIFTN